MISGSQAWSVCGIDPSFRDEALAVHFRHPFHARLDEDLAHERYTSRATMGNPPPNERRLKADSSPTILVFRKRRLEDDRFASRITLVVPPTVIFS